MISKKQPDNDAYCKALKLLEVEIKHERELREQATAMSATALQKQANEYERRLEELNHAHARSLADRSEFLQKSLYEQTQKELSTWKLQITADMATTAERLRAEQIATSAELSKNQWMISILLAAVMVALSIANYLVK